MKKLFLCVLISGLVVSGCLGTKNEPPGFGKPDLIIEDVKIGPMVKTLHVDSLEKGYEIYKGPVAIRIKNTRDPLTNKGAPVMGGFKINLFLDWSLFYGFNDPNNGPTFFKFKQALNIGQTKTATGTLYVIKQGPPLTLDFDITVDSDNIVKERNEKNNKYTGQLPIL